MATFVPTKSGSRALNVDHVVEVQVGHDSTIWKLSVVMPDGRYWTVSEREYHEHDTAPHAVAWWAAVCGEMKAVV